MLGEVSTWMLGSRGGHGVRTTENMLDTEMFYGDHRCTRWSGDVRSDNWHEVGYMFCLNGRTFFKGLRA